MKTKQVEAKDLKPGMYLDMLGGVQMVAKIEPYTGPLDCITGIARFNNGSGISLTQGQVLTVVEA